MGRTKIVASGVCQFSDSRETIVRKRVPLQQSPRILRRIERRSIARQLGSVEFAVEDIDILSYQFGAARFQSLPDHQSRKPKQVYRVSGGVLRGAK